MGESVCHIDVQLHSYWIIMADDRKRKENVCYASIHSTTVLAV